MITKIEINMKKKIWFQARARNEVFYTKTFTKQNFDSRKLVGGSIALSMKV